VSVTLLGLVNRKLQYIRVGDTWDTKIFVAHGQ